MQQLDLFDVGQRLNERQPAIKRQHPPCTPDLLGSGPAGQTCGDCLHAVAPGLTARRYYKCALMRHRWTHGRGSDIKLKWPACSKFFPKEEPQ